MSQKFLIEQPVMLQRFEELADKYGITLILENGDNISEQEGHNSKAATIVQY